MGSSLIGSPGSKSSQGSPFGSVPEQSTVRSCCHTPQTESKPGQGQHRQHQQHNTTQPSPSTECRTAASVKRQQASNKKCQDTKLTARLRVLLLQALQAMLGLSQLHLQPLVLLLWGEQDRARACFANLWSVQRTLATGVQPQPQVLGLTLAHPRQAAIPGTSQHTSWWVYRSGIRHT